MKMRSNERPDAGVDALTCGLLGGVDVRHPVRETRVQRGADQHDVGVVLFGSLAYVIGERIDVIRGRDEQDAVARPSELLAALFGSEIVKPGLTRLVRESAEGTVAAEVLAHDTPAEQLKVLLRASR